MRKKLRIILELWCIESTKLFIEHLWYTVLKKHWALCLISFVHHIISYIICKNWLISPNFSLTLKNIDVDLIPFKVLNLLLWWCWHNHHIALILITRICRFITPMWLYQHHHVNLKSIGVKPHRYFLKYKNWILINIKWELYRHHIHVMY